MNCRKRSPQFLAIVVAIICLVGKPTQAHAQFGGGTQIVFDPQMFARQLQQLQQETATVTNLAQSFSTRLKIRPAVARESGNPIRICLRTSEI